MLGLVSAQTHQTSSPSRTGAARSPDEQKIRITRDGSQPPSKGPAENFTGSVRIDIPFRASSPARAYGSRITFEAGARTAWRSDGQSGAAGLQFGESERFVEEAKFEPERPSVEIHDLRDLVNIENCPSELHCHVIVSRLTAKR